MPSSRRLEVVRECYRAYETGDRGLIERHLAEGFRFSSPADVDIGLATYFERCWPNADAIESFEFERLVEVGDEVLVTYEAARRDGKPFRNTEIFGFEGDKVARVEVYFGWDLPGS